MLREKNKKLINEILVEYGNNKFLGIYDIFKQELNNNLDSVITEEFRGLIDFRTKDVGTIAVFVPDYDKIEIHIKTNNPSELIMSFNCRDGKGIIGRFHTWTIYDLEDMKNKKESIIGEIKEYLMS